MLDLELAVYNRSVVNPWGTSNVFIEKELMKSVTPANSASPHATPTHPFGGNVTENATRLGGLKGLAMISYFAFHILFT